MSWRPEVNEFAQELAGRFNLKFLKGSEVTAEIEGQTKCREDGGIVYRKIAGVSPEEKHICKMVLWWVNPYPLI